MQEPTNRQGLFSEDFIKKLKIAIKNNNALVPIELSIGEKNIGDFLIESLEITEIIQGTNAVNYVCYDHEYKNKKIAKTYSDKYRYSHPEIVNKFWEESNTWIAIPDHQNLIKAINVRVIDFRTFLFLEYAEGNDLRSIIAEKKLSKKDIPSIAIQLCKGLKFIHDNGLIHGDLNPSNVIISQSGIAKITDFGLSLHIDNLNITENDMKKKVSFDIYMLCLLLYELITFTIPSKDIDKRLLRDNTNEKLCNLIERCINSKENNMPFVGMMLDSLQECYPATKVEDCLQNRSADKKHVYSKLINKINSYLNLNQLDKAIELSEKVKNDFHKERMPVYQNALICYSLKDYKKSISLCLKALNLPPDSAFIIQQDQILSLIKRCEIRLRLRDENPTKIAVIAQIRLYEGDIVESMSLVDLALYLDKYNHTALNLKGIILFNLGKFKQAKEYLQKSLMTASEDKEKQLIKGQIKDCEQIVAGIVPINYQFSEYLKKAKACVKDRQYKSAKQNYELALEIHADHLPTLYEFGKFLLEIERIPKSIDIFRNCLKIDSDKAAVWNDLGRAYHIDNQITKALECYTKATGLDPQYPSYWSNKGNAHIFLNQYTEGLCSFLEALKLNCSHKNSLLGLRTCLKQKDKLISKRRETELTINNEYSSMTNEDFLLYIEKLSVFLFIKMFVNDKTRHSFSEKYTNAILQTDSDKLQRLMQNDRDSERKYNLHLILKP